MNVDLTTCETVQKRLGDLTPAEYNPRKMTAEAFAALKNSLKKYGPKAPIVWNRRSGNIVWGHQRWRALRELAEDKGQDPDATLAPVHVVDLDIDEEIRLNLAGNSEALCGEWSGAEQSLLERLKLDDPAAHDELRLDELMAKMDSGTSLSKDTTAALAEIELEDGDIEQAEPLDKATVFYPHARAAECRRKLQKVVSEWGGIIVWGGAVVLGGGVA